jgi:hypothetical protein
MEFDKLKVNRVVPLDVIARETYGQHGWIESSHGHEFDTGNEITAKSWEYPFQDYHYDKDVRKMSPEEIKRIKQHFYLGRKNRLKYRHGNLNRAMRLHEIVKKAVAWHPSQREIGIFMYGGCGALALAVQKLTGMPLVALVEPDGENERPVHVMVKLPDGRYLDINGAQTYEEITTELRDEHECDTDRLSLIHASPLLLKLWVTDGYFDPVSPQLAREARMVAAKICSILGLK